VSTYKLHTNKTWSDSERELRETFQKWGVHRFAIEPNTQSRNLNSKYLIGTERAVTVRYWKAARGEPEREVVLSLDTQESPALNLRALGLCLEEMRMLDVRGIGEVAASAYMQLAAPKTERDPYEVLGLRPGADAVLVNAAYAALAKQAHPDKGGTDVAMAELNAARDALLAKATAA